MFRAILLCLCFLSSLISTESVVTPSLLELLKAMEVSHDGTLESIVEQTQKRWVRPIGKERWEVADTLTAAQRKAVFAFCYKEKFFSELNPRHKEYDYGVIMGGSVGRLEKRIAHLVKLAQSGTHFKKVILLSGARPLDTKVESIPPGCKTEGDAILFLWKAQPLSREVVWEAYDHPMINGENGALYRPTTADTINRWVKSNPQPGRCLLFSNQPYCHYQQATAEVLLPKEFTVESAGVKADPSAQNGIVLLDTIAAWLFFESKKTN